MFLVLAVLTASAATAEPVAAPGDKAKAAKLKLSETRGEPGQWARVEARFKGGDEKRYYISGANVSAPLSIQVVAQRFDAPVRVSLHRQTWAVTEAEGTTGDRGLFQFDGRAYGDVGIRLQSASGTPTRATLLIWQGEPVSPGLQTVYAPPGSPRAAQAGMTGAGAGQTRETGERAGSTTEQTSPLMLGIFGLLVVIAGLLAALVFRKGGAKAAAVLFVVATFVPLPFSAGTARAQAPELFEGEGADSYRERIEAAEQHARELSQQVANNRAEIERLRMLLESDRENETDPDRLPPVPLSCRPPMEDGDRILSSREADSAWENFEQCQQCYAEPLREFEQHLQYYEKLRILYSETSKFVAKVIDTGDKAPKPHYLLENAWAAQKTKIRVDFAKTQQAYDAKLLELNDKLSAILDRIGDCESRLNNNPMWRRTSGTFFHQTMANSYKRTD